ncbi:hypothetical protein HYPSUDRAFT_40208 [Hypholoma sublateritium FD-334 SS-4]|uniref:Uncharacterized protein n=1 Tax=Hypholoma sublateritium (strain FD-334 SS-4) TaxID=945553 RepID=A0A0D2L7I4_HYPSF|nr:hypothetical protein HYPSUDRAFT_40208 [Hypholoma sublateritium FD-334 SS-4]
MSQEDQDGRVIALSQSRAIRLRARRTLPINVVFPDEHRSDEHISGYASSTLTNHIETHPQYFPVTSSEGEDKRTQISTWATWVKENVKEDWEKHLAHIKAHEDELAALRREMAEMKQAAADESRVQSVRLMMAIRDRTMADERLTLIKERDELKKEMSVQREGWKLALEGFQRVVTHGGNTVAVETQRHEDGVCIQSPGPQFDEGDSISP